MKDPLTLSLVSGSSTSSAFPLQGLWVGFSLGFGLLLLRCLRFSIVLFLKSVAVAFFVGFYVFRTRKLSYEIISQILRLSHSA